MLVKLLIPIVVCIAVRPGFAQSAKADWEEDSNLCSDPSEASWLRHFNWAIRGGGDSVALTAGYDLLSKESLCGRVFMGEEEFLYNKKAIAINLDYQYTTGDFPDAIRPAIEASMGTNPWGWFGAGVAAGPVLRGGKIVAGFSGYITAVNFSVEWRYETARPGFEPRFVTTFGFSNGHLGWNGLYD